MKRGKVRVDVTQRDIRLGLPQIGCKCPLARAIRRCCGIRKTSVDVQGENVDIGFHSYQLPKKCEIFVQRFDGREAVKPFSFTLRLP